MTKLNNYVTGLIKTTNKLKAVIAEQKELIEKLNEQLNEAVEEIIDLNDELRVGSER